MPWEQVANFGIALAFWTAVALFAYLLLFHWLRTLAGRTRFEADNVVLRTIRTPLIAAIIGFAIVQALEQLELTSRAATVVRSAYVVLLIIAGSYLGWRIVKEVFLRWLTARASETESRVDDLLLPLVATVGPLIFFLVALTTSLQYLGIDVGLLAASLGIIGLIIGLAFQESLANLFSGIYLMIDPPFVEGDLINLGDKVFCVEKVGLRMTRMYDMESHALIFVPNKTLTAEQIVNITKPTIDLKVRMSVKMPASLDPVRGITLLHDVVASHRNVLGLAEVKLPALRKRINGLVAADRAVAEGERAATLQASFVALETWLAGDAGTEEDHARLLDVRKEMNARLTEAQVAVRRLPKGRLAGDALERLKDALGGRGPQTQEISERRIDRLNTAFVALKEHFSAVEIEPVRAAIARLNELDAHEDRLEATINRAEQQREAELDKLLGALVWAGDWVAEELLARGHRDEAARMSLWVRSVAAVYSELEVRESLAGLDLELARLIDWLRTLEAGGLSNDERGRVRTLFGAWGGLRMMEARRVNELRRRITRWMDWKEKDTLNDEEYYRLLKQWERKLRTLSRRIPDTGVSDEEALDSALIETRTWMHSINFLETLPEWKLPSVAVRSFGPDTTHYSLMFHVDDIKEQHFQRERYVKSGVLLDLYEVLRREGIEGVEAEET